MNKELEDRLCREFPNLYADMYKDPIQSCMAFGIETGDGWFDLIYDLSSKLEKIIVEYKEKYPDIEYWPKASQVKEKYSSLRFYMTTSTDEMERLIDEAESKSYHLCEMCGKEGQCNLNGWLAVRCRDCWNSDVGYDETTKLKKEQRLKDLEDGFGETD